MVDTKSSGKEEQTKGRRDGMTNVGESEFKMKGNWRQGKQKGEMTN